MARARNIKPGFFTNDELAEVDPLGRILFIGLWTLADREGRMEDRPRRIKAEVLPYDNADADELLDQLAKHGFILRYSVGDDRFIQVLNFNKHQNPHMKEAASEIPAPDLTGASPVQGTTSTETSPADSLNLIPDTGYPHSDSSDSDESPSTTNDKQDKSTSVNERFIEFWSLYPKKAGKGDAERKFKQIRWADISFADLMAALARQMESEQWQAENGRFIPNPSTWIFQKRWGDELPPQRATSTAGSISEPQGYSRDPDEADRQLKSQLQELQRKALNGSEGEIISLRRGA